MTKTKSHQKGKIARVIGVVVDAYFPEHTPDQLNALTVEGPNGTVTLEVQQHLGNGLVRSVAMSSTDGLYIDQEVSDTGAPISVPVGEATLGRVFDVTGKAIDGCLLYTSDAADEA